MAKKTFRHNPAEQFLSIQTEDATAEQTQEAESQQPVADDPAAEAKETVGAVVEQETPAAGTSAAESGSNDAPVETVTQAESPARRKRQKKSKATVEYKLDPRYVEKRTRRLQLVLQPSLYDRVRKRAAADGVSVNDLIHSILDREITKE